MDNYVITIARGFGSGGKQIARKLAESLGIGCYDYHILALASQYSGYGEELFQDEQLNGAYWTNLLMKIPVSKYPRPVQSRFVSDLKMFEIQSEIIRRLARTESCVIVGKCADYVLRDTDNTISIYIEAPREYCVRRVMEMMPGTTRQQAHSMIARTDKYRSDYYRFYTGGKEWNNVVNYDLTINTGRMGEDRAVDLIIQYLDMKFPVGGGAKHT